MTQGITISVEDVLDLMLPLPGGSVIVPQIKNFPGVNAMLDLEITIPTPQDAGSDSSQSAQPAQGGDPKTPLEAIATAIGSAETILNGDNLVISEAAVELNMNVNVPGLAGANTTIKLGVEPRAL